MIPFPNKKYNIIYADPPWKYDYPTTKGFMQGGASTKYDVMELEEIKSLPVYSICETNTVLFLWVTVPMLEEGLQVLKSWGFKYKTMLTWGKVMSLGMGWWFRGQTEHLVLGIKGQVKPFRCVNQSNLIQSNILKHSVKPHQFRNIIVRATNKVFKEPKRIELFARQKIEGWDQWGNQVEQVQQLEEFC